MQYLSNSRRELSNSRSHNYMPIALPMKNIFHPPPSSQGQSHPLQRSTSTPSPSPCSATMSVDQQHLQFASKCREFELEIEKISSHVEHLKVFIYQKRKVDEKILTYPTSRLKMQSWLCLWKKANQPAIHSQSCLEGISDQRHCLQTIFYSS